MFCFLSLAFRLFVFYLVYVTLIGSFGVTYLKMYQQFIGCLPEYWQIFVVQYVSITCLPALLLLVMFLVWYALFKMPWKELSDN